MVLIRIDIVFRRMTHVSRHAVKYKVIKDNMNERINEPSTTIYEDIVMLNKVALLFNYTLN